MTVTTTTCLNITEVTEPKNPHHHLHFSLKWRQGLQSSLYFPATESKCALNIVKACTCERSHAQHKNTSSSLTVSNSFYTTTASIYITNDSVYVFLLHPPPPSPPLCHSVNILSMDSFSIWNIMVLSEVFSLVLCPLCVCGCVCVHDREGECTRTTVQKQKVHKHLFDPKIFIT